MSGDYQARFYEGLGVKFPRSTRQNPKAPAAENGELQEASE